MPAAPKIGQGKGANARPPESKRITRSQSSLGNHQLEFPALQGTAESQSTPPAKPPGEKPPTTPTGAAATQPPKTLPTPTPLHKIAKMIEQIISKYNPPGQVKQALTDVMELAKKAAEEDKGAGIHVPLKAVKILHERFKADLLLVHDSLDTKITDIQASQRKLLSSTETLNKSSENLSTATKELESKLVKVNDATDKIANTANSYRDALMAKPSNSLRTNANPKVLQDLDRRTRQILLGYSSIEDNATLNISLLDLKDKANKAVTEMENTDRPETVRIDNVTRTRDGSLLLLLNSKEAADWLRSPDTEDRFLDKFAIGACIKDRNYNVLLRWVPITFDPNNSTNHREVEEMNSLPEHSLQKARWIKPANRRRAGQTKAHAILTLTTADVANRVIRDGLDICGVRTRAERTKQEPLQCLKCRGWEHKAQDCQASIETCGSCGENHRTNTCKNKGTLYCASCKTSAHASWDRTCPEFRRRCANYDERYPENKMVYYPTDQDWTLTSRPSRIPPEERFPQHLAVSSIPPNRRKPDRPVVRLPPSSTPGRDGTPQTQTRQCVEQQQQGETDPVERFLNRSQPKLVPLGRGREEGELSDLADHDSLLELTDNAIVEKALTNWWDEPPSDVGWTDQPTGW
jgi:hypothetical protein